MSNSSVQGVRFAGLASAVPDLVVRNADLAGQFGVEEVRRIIHSVGVVERHIAPEGICTSDLCLAAAERLLADLGWARDSIDTLIFVSQTPDYVLPATSCSLQQRLKLEKHCVAFDVNLGCSGYTHGLWLATHLIASGASRRTLLLAGETASRPVNPHDRSAVLLFGDAGTATLIERDEAASAISFELGTDGSGQNGLIIPAGGFRSVHSERTSIPCLGDDGNTRSLEQLFMDGSEVFLFTLDVVPELISRILASAGWTIGDVDAFVFHQANRFMLTHLANAIGLPAEKMLLSLEKFGNTSSASIPLTITDQLADRAAKGPLKLVLAGFGVGFSWSAVALTIDRPIISPLVILNVDECRARLRDEGSHLPPSLRS